MYGILYGDVIAHLISRTRDLLAARPESYARSVEVSNRKSAKSTRAVVFTTSPGGGTSNTLRTSYVTVDVIANDEGDTVDLVNLVLALVTSRGGGGLVGSGPIADLNVNGGPNADPSVDGFFKQTAELEVRHRGVNL
ncbi:hypothetical protein [Curtobacterium sp. UCD-KPL2560]|uniref:hypothetical protein n=1 Tax=Curtobacterium sp. UCD-KPL2560 TaxID=1885315 RepID=UPI000826C94C|nr:hypothetical protein [Curtobacterium sp. UCD-KPL2560]